MIHVDEIQDALDQADTREIERAFRALVGFPHAEEIGGSFTAERLDDLLGRVATELRLNQSQAPTEVCEAVQARLGLPVPLYPQASYADVALLVGRYRGLWRAAFLAHLSGGQGVSQ